MLTQFRRLMVGVFALLLLAPFSVAQSARHPLDDLTTDEYWAVDDVITASGHLDPDTRFISILLHEPEKSAVLAWKPGTLFTREADIVLQRKEKVIEARVDISSRKLESWKEAPGAQGALTGAFVDRWPILWCTRSVLRSSIGIFPRFRSIARRWIPASCVYSARRVTPNLTLLQHVCDAIYR